MNLWPFQDEDITALEPQRGALIHWDPGTGKTIAAIERDKRIRQEIPEGFAIDWPTLIVAGKSYHDQWANVIEDTYPRPRIFLVGDDRDFFLTELVKGTPGFYVLNWEVLRMPSHHRPIKGKGRCEVCNEIIVREEESDPWVHCDSGDQLCWSDGTLGSTAFPKERENWAGNDLYSVLTKTKFLHVIGDEVHHAQNRKAQSTKVLKQINRNARDPLGYDGYRTGLTGTAIINLPPGLWSILNWLRPRDFTSYWRFFDRYANWIPSVKSIGGPKSIQYRTYLGPKNSAELRERIKPFVVLRKKEDVLPELPDRYYSTIRVDLAPKQRRAYNSMRDHMVAWLGADEQQPLAATSTVAKLQRLQQFALAHAEVADGGTVELSEPSSKLDALVEILEDSSEQFVVFSQFKGFIRLANARLSKHGISSVVFTGDTSQAERRAALDKFIAGEIRVFLATIGAGGEGIDGLQRASNVVFADRSWSPAQNDQAEARHHRAGQENAVHVIDIVAKNTVDQGKNTKLNLKRDWIRQVLG